VESMGFIMDNLNFRARPAAEQDQMMKALPVFQRDPAAAAAGRGSGAGASGMRAAAKPVAQGGAQKGPNASVIGKLFGSFVLLALALLGCVHVPTEKELREAQAHY